MPHWVVIPDALKRLRVERAGSHAALAQHSGLSERMLRKYEKKQNQIIRVATLRVLETSLGAKATEFARLVEDHDDDGAAKNERGARLSPAVLPRTALETIVDAERARRAAEPKKHGAAPLTARALQDVFTAFRLHEGCLFYLRGVVRAQRGISREEAKLLGGAAGVSARFHVYKRVTKEHELGVTVHASRAEHTRALQKALDGEITVVVKVVVISDEASDAGQGFSSFITAITDKRPWTLVVEEIL